MHTALSPDNPHPVGRYAFAWEKAPPDAAALLDFGCYDGKFLESLRSRRIRRLAGVDASRDAVASANQRCPHLDVRHLPAGGRLPFADGEFDCVTLLDVIEHVNDQLALLGELRRVLRPGGTLIVTVPGQHTFSFLDAGNLKFRFPRLHRWFYLRRHTPEEYEHRYAANPDGLVGDVSADKRWHEHFSRDKMARLLAQAGLTAAEFDGTGLFYRPLAWLRLLVGWFRPARRLIEKLLTWDARRFESANLFCVAVKR